MHKNNINKILSVSQPLYQKHVYINPKDKIRSNIVIVGDTSFGENYQSKMEKNGKSNILKQKGYHYCLSIMKPILAHADLVIANLETPITNLTQSPFSGRKQYLHWADIEKTPKALINHNIHTVSYANNHNFDFGKKGFLQSLDILRKNGIQFFGAGLNSDQAAYPFLGKIRLNEKVFRFAIISAFEEFIKYRDDFSVYAGENKCGVNKLSLTSISKTINKLKSTYPNIFIILLPHWGKNYCYKTTKQTEYAEKCMQLGVDLILGHGSHMLQEIEKINGKWCIYSLGNFMFNSHGRYKKMNVPPYSMVAKLIISSNNHTNTFDLRLYLYPIITDNTITHYQPRFVTSEEFREVCEILTMKNKSNSTNINALRKSKDSTGYFFDIPIQIKSPIHTDEKDYIGFICNHDGLTTKRNELRGNWPERAFAMDKIIKEAGKKFIIYSPKDVDLKQNRIKGFTIKNNQLNPVITSVPKVNFDLFLPIKNMPKRQGPGVSALRAWAKRNDTLIYPSREYINIAKDKYLTYRLIKKIKPNLQPVTDIYIGHSKQFLDFFKSNTGIFLKPLLGARGDGIFVLKKQHKNYLLTYYKDKNITTFNLSNLKACAEKVNSIIKDEKYIIQQAIETAQFSQSTFDVRVVMLHDGLQWQCLDMSRVGVENSDVSNVTQGGNFYPSEEILTKVFGGKDGLTILNDVKKNAYDIIQYFSKHYPHFVNEVSFDFLVDKNKNIYFDEMTPKPGFGVTRLYRTFTHPESMRTFVNERYMKPYGTYVAKFLLTKLSSITNTN